MGSNTTVALTGLARRINAEHEATRASIQKGLEHALNAGELLEEAKAIIPHGHWLPWLKDNCSFSERTAQLYMKVARERERLGAESASLADLTLEGAAQHLAKPKSLALRPPVNDHLTRVHEFFSDDELARLRRFLTLFPEALEATNDKGFNILTKPQLLVDALVFYDSDPTEASERMKVSLDAFIKAISAAFECGYRAESAYLLFDQVICTRFCAAPAQEVLDELDEYRERRDEYRERCEERGDFWKWEIDPADGTPFALYR